MTIYYTLYHAEPLPESEDFHSCGGAYVSCWISAHTAEQANAAARAVIVDQGWRVVRVEEACVPVNEDYYQEGDEGLEGYLQAVEDGASYVFDQWPNEAQDHDTVH